MKKIILIILAALVALVLGGFITLNAIGAPADKNDTRAVNVTVEQGSGTYDIAAALAESGVIDSVRSFRIISKISGNDGRYIAGTYKLSRSMSMKAISDLIASGKSQTNKFTVIPGQTVEKIARALDSEGIVAYDEFMDAEENHDFGYEFIAPADNKEYRLEGYLMPETYLFDPGTDAVTVIDAMLSRFDEVMYRNIYEKQRSGYSFEEILTIASIIQREAGNDEDMVKVSSVISNRLDRDMALQMDSIVSYILKKDAVNLSSADIKVKSDYNPYDHKGLPPGPICSPSEAAVKAACEPAHTDYLYFVLSDKLDGSAVFTRDYDRFLKAKESYYKAYRKAHPDGE